MSLDDPGWGGYVPLPDRGGQQDPPVHAGMASAGGPLGHGPPTKRTSRRALVVAGTASAAVAVIIIVVVALSGHGKTQPPLPPVTRAQSSAPQAPTATGAAATDSLLSKNEYTGKADSICQSSRSDLDYYHSRRDAAGLAPVLQSMLSDLRALGDPAQDAQLSHTWLDLVGRAVSNLMAGNSTAADIAIMESDRAAGQFGLQVCNFGA